MDAAIDYGYRHIDCAFEYENEAHIGSVLRHQFEVKGLRRRDLFITSKLWCTYHQKDKVGENCIKSLRALNLEYLDLYLIQWPVSLQVKIENLEILILRGISQASFTLAWRRDLSHFTNR